MAWGVAYSDPAWSELNALLDPERLRLMDEISDWARPGPPCSDQRTFTHPDTDQLFVTFDEILGSGYKLTYSLGVQPNAIVFVVSIRKPVVSPPE
jgi:hypothetical protein